MEFKYAIRWRLDGSLGLHWNIMGILPDGRFYGDIRDSQARRGTSVSGAVANWSRAQEILHLIAGGPAIESRPCFARLARYTISLSQVEIVFDYDIGDEFKSLDARAFLELIQLLEPEISKAYKRIA